MMTLLKEIIIDSAMKLHMFFMERTSILGNSNKYSMRVRCKEWRMETMSSKYDSLDLGIHHSYQIT